MDVAIILINYKDYARRYLAECIASVRAQKYSGSFKVIIVDNESSQETVDYIKNVAPEAEIVVNKNNDGFAKGNNDGVKKAIELGFQYFVLLNMDTEVENDWLQKLVDAAAKLDNWGAVQSRAMLYSDKNKINTLGNSLHYLGFGFSSGSGVDYIAPTTNYHLPIVITYFSGVSVLLRRDVLEKVGMFDEEFWMYHDDLELSWKIRLAGYNLYLAPDSVVYHKYEFAKSIKQYYWMERNRFIFFLTVFHPLTIILLLPMFMVMEIGLIFFSIKGGFLGEKIKVYQWIIEADNWRYIKLRRAKIRKIRKLKDRDLIKHLVSKIEFQEIDNPLLRDIANPIMTAYWWIAKKIIIW
ncbi:MAG: glycosyltransferase family 2 protein [Patescibacteria group bacterium]|jgi:hypothetical protein